MRGRERERERERERGREGEGAGGKKRERKKQEREKERERERGRQGVAGGKSSLGLAAFGLSSSMLRQAWARSAIDAGLLFTFKTQPLKTGTSCINADEHGKLQNKMLWISDSS